MSTPTTNTSSICPTADRVVAKFLKMLECDAATDELERAAIVLAGIIGCDCDIIITKSILRGAGMALHEYASACGDVVIIKNLIRGFIANLSTKHAIRYGCIIMGYMGKDIDVDGSNNEIMYHVGSAIAKYEMTPTSAIAPASKLPPSPGHGIIMMMKSILKNSSVRCDELAIVAQLTGVNIDDIYDLVSSEICIREKLRKRLCDMIAQWESAQ